MDNVDRRKERGEKRERRNSDWRSRSWERKESGERKTDKYKG